MQETIDKLKKKGFDNNRFEQWLKEDFVKRTYDTATLKALWYGNEVMEEEDELLAAIAGMDKNELDQYAIDTYGVDLDKRFKKEAMIEELKDAINYYDDDTNK